MYLQFTQLRYENFMILFPFPLKWYTKRGKGGKRGEISSLKGKKRMDRTWNSPLPHWEAFCYLISHINSSVVSARRIIRQRPSNIKGSLTVKVNFTLSNRKWSITKPPIETAHNSDWIYKQILGVTSRPKPHCLLSSKYKILKVWTSPSFVPDLAD